jgi:sugar lactone lactonase YvrE
MARLKIGLAALGLIIGLLGLGAAPASAWDRGFVNVLTVLPDVTPGVQSSVEGLTVGPDGNIYVPTFGFNTKGALTGNAVLFVISPRGQVIRQVTIANSSPHMLGLAFNPVTHALWVLDFGAGNVLQVDPLTGSSTVLNAGGPIANSGLNALTFDPAGNGYVSDSFNGVIWQLPPHGGTPVSFSSGPLLGPGSGLTPPFGANGVEFNNEYTVMYVADTAFHQIIQIPVSLNHGTAVATGAPSILITGINAPDGIMVDRNDNIWICANQEDEIVVINPNALDPATGKPLSKVIAKLGDFYGIDQNGIAQGFLFPASLAFSLDGTTLYVSNLTLYLPYAGAMPAIDSDWTLQVKGYTVSAIPAFIPPVLGGGH